MTSGRRKRGSAESAPASLAAISVGTDLQRHAKALRHAWESALSGSPADVRPVIDRSWGRLLRRGLSPGDVMPRRLIDAEGIEDLRSASGLHVTIDVLRGSLTRLADEAHHVLIVTDREGCVLWLEGDTAVRSAASAIELSEGMLWTEDSAGTNAIGTALAIDRPVQVFAAEHFLPEQHRWWCSASPIHDPRTGQPLGVVDLSGPAETAHPHSLALVMTAAALAEEILRQKYDLNDLRLRHRYLEETTRRPLGDSALVAADGRVLMSNPSSWLSGRLEVGPSGPVAPEDETIGLTLEPLIPGEAWIAWRQRVDRTPASAPSVLRVRLLKRPRAVVQCGTGPEHQLSLRHAEILVLLVVHPNGLTNEQLTFLLYGDVGNPVSVRAEMSRLRRLLGAHLATRPYRLVGDIDIDIDRVQQDAAAGALANVLHDYPGPLLPDSSNERVEQARDEVHGTIQRAVIARGVETIWAWLNTDGGREDPEALKAFLDRSAPDDSRRGAAEARLHSLQVRVGLLWGLSPTR